MDNKTDWKALLRTVAFYLLSYLAGAGTYHVAAPGPDAPAAASCKCGCGCKDCKCAK